MIEGLKRILYSLFEILMFNGFLKFYNFNGFQKFEITEVKILTGASLFKFEIHKTVRFHFIMAYFSLITASQSIEQTEVNLHPKTAPLKKPHVCDSNQQLSFSVAPYIPINFLFSMTFLLIDIVAINKPHELFK